MKRNIGNIDRAFRAIAGAILIALIFTGPQTLWGLLGIPLLLTAAIGWCPPYHLFGISTCKGGSCKTGGKTHCGEHGCH